jgi:hypothetical protein
VAPSGLSSGLKRDGHQIAEGYSIPNTERNVKARYCVLENDGYKGVNDETGRAINVLDSSPGGISKGSIHRGS